MSKRAWVEVALIVIGAFWIFTEIQQGISLLGFYLGGISGLPDFDPWILPLPVLSLLMAALLIRAAAPLARMLVTEGPDDAGAPRLETSALQLCLQLVGVFACLGALSELPTALAAGMTSADHQQHLESAAPVDRMWQFITTWQLAFNCAFKAALGAFVCLRAGRLAAWIRSRDRSAPLATQAPQVDQGSSRA